MLSGHTHGGVVRIPYYGSPLRSILRIGKQFYAGLNRYGDFYIYTNRGLGTFWLRIRINCRPEVSRFSLTPFAIAKNKITSARGRNRSFSAAPSQTARSSAQGAQAPLTRGGCADARSRDHRRNRSQRRSEHASRCRQSKTGKLRASSAPGQLAAASSDHRCGRDAAASRRGRPAHSSRRRNVRRRHRRRFRIRNRRGGGGRRHDHRRLRLPVAGRIARRGDLEMERQGARQARSSTTDSTSRFSIRPRKRSRKFQGRSSAA